MDININGTALNATLENEKKLREVVESIKDWLSSSDMEIKELLCDEQKLYPGQIDSWGDKDIQDIKKLDITAITQLEKYIEDLQVIYQYITMLRKAIESWNRPLIEDILVDSKYISNALDYFIPGRTNSAPYSRQFLDLLDTLELTKESSNSENETIIQFLNQITELLKALIEEVTDPFSVLKSTSRALSELIPQMTDVSILLQTGQDRKAADSVLIFIELSEKLIRLYKVVKELHSIDVGSISIGDESFDVFYKDMNGILKELSLALDSSDTVLIGDLLEYEIVPKIETLLSFITLIEEKNGE